MGQYTLGENCMSLVAEKKNYKLFIRVIQTLILLFVFYSSSLYADESPKVILSRLTDSIYIAEDYYLAKENSVIYIGESFVTVVGATWTPSTAKKLAYEVAKITDKPIKEVINTNQDLDRVGGNSYFKSIGSKIIATKLTHDLLAKNGKRSVELARKESDYPSIKIVLPDTVFEGDFTLQGGSIRGIYLGPSHKPDDIFVYFPKEKVLYAGCILKEQIGNTDGADLVEYPKTLQKLKDLKLPIVTIISGHMSPIHGPELIDQFLNMLKQAKK
jgi:metallo-beta-lactamase class B